MNRKKLYLSLPITGRELKSIDMAFEAKRYYENQGFQVINPHDVKKELEEELGRIALEKEIMSTDLYFLSECDAMILLPGWESSKGCNLEIRFAEDYNIPIYEVYTNRQLMFKSSLKNNVQRTRKDHWITQPVHIEEPEIGYPILQN